MLTQILNNTGLVLEGGGMRGAFTTGVLDLFLEKQLHIKNCLAVSAGSAHACSYLANQKGRSIIISTKYLNDWRYCSIKSFLKTGDLFGADFLYNQIPTVLHPVDNKTFKNSKCVFQAVITNCTTGDAEYPFVTDMLSDLEYIRASSSLPFVSQMVAINGNLYFDGGIADAIPIKQSIKQGNKKHVVILTRDLAYRKEKSRTLPLFKLLYHNFPNLYKQMKNRHNIYNQTAEYLAQLQAENKVFIIAPSNPLPVGRIERNEQNVMNTYNIGYQTAKKQFDDLIRYLEG